MSTFITELESDGTGPRVAVKDLIDVAGVITTAASKAVADFAAPATADAALLKGSRAAGARIVGKANLHELAFGTSGLNQWSGTPVN
ncbi:MAG TPA: amidase family protein, partial [Acidimicrobiales bacterium]